MFPSPFPEYISFFCVDLSTTPVFPLLPEEEEFLKTLSSSKRQTEFSHGRSCAHQALAKFKLEAEPIPRNAETREPCWPKGVRGSITHSGEYAAAAVGLADAVSGIGIDLESLSRPVDFNISRHVCVEQELEWLKTLTAEQANQGLRIIFSAKESIFKCLFRFQKHTCILRMRQSRLMRLILNLLSHSRKHVPESLKRVSGIEENFQSLIKCC